jgi:ABC-type branched-subunit amino acid transport system substrate-binding protein
MRRTGKLLVATAVALAAAACSSSSSDSVGGGTTSGGQTVKIGVLTDLTGPGSSSNATVEDGIKAGAAYAASQGYNVKYVMADSGTNPSTVLTAAKKLVTQEHVTAILASSAVLFLASDYLTAHNVPVIGAGQDGPEWVTAKNMFSVFGALHATQVATTAGNIYKLLGITNLGSLGYSISPLSAEAAKSSAASAKHVGLSVGYLNANFPFGSTNVAPVALAMKQGGVDGYTGAVEANTSFALLTALRQQGVNLKASVFATGYGGDTTSAGAATVNAAQGSSFLLPYEPIEMQTAATKQFTGYLKSAGVTGQATFSEYNMHTGVGLLVRALKAAGSANPTSEKLIATLSGIHDWDALGLFGTHRLDLSDRTSIVAGVDQCQWVTTLHGTTFQVVKGADPMCGKIIPGLTVSPSSW